MPLHLRLMIGSLCVLLLLHAGAWAAEGEPGEFSLPEVVPLTAVQRDVLRELVERDPEAAALAKQIEAEAAPLLDAQPHPLEEIQYEGLVNTDPRRVATVEKIREMVDVARLLRYWQATGDDRAAATLRRFIAAWASTYRVTGNDVNENKLYPLLVAYHALRDDFDDDERADVDGWVRTLGEHHANAVRESKHFTNRYTKHVRLLALCGVILDRPAWVEAAHEGIRRFVTQSLYADGTSLDLKRRDTLTYHTSALRPAIELAMLAGEGGRELYTWESPQGGSIQKSVDYVVPYAMGEKTREEWVNTQVQLDRDRAAAGLEKYRAGRLYDPEDALDLMAEASYFDPALMRVVLHLIQSDAKRFPTWRTLVNEAARRGQAGQDGSALAPASS